MSWSKLKKQFRELLAPSVVKRVDFHSTRYHGYGPYYDKGRAWITWDGEEITNMAYDWGPWADSRFLASDEKSVFGQYRLGEAMFRYLNNSIDDILCHEDTVIRALGMLDRRLGKKRLQKMDVSEQFPLEKMLYILRCEAEGIRLSPNLSAQKMPLQASLENKRLIHKQNLDQQRQRDNELNALAETALKEHGEDNIRQLIRQPSSVQREALRSELGRAVYDVLQLVPSLKEAVSLLLHVERYSSLLASERFGKATLALLQVSDRWIRTPETWKPSSKNAQRQFASLARHLLAQYDVPTFLDAAWFTESLEARQWYCWLAAGENLRKASNLPIKMTKLMAHHFLLAPDEYSIGAAFRWAQIRSLGGDRILCDAVAQTRLVRDFVDDPFWMSVFRYFIDNPMLDRAHVGPIVDFIWNRRFEPVIEFVERGVMVEREPRQPLFSMRGRSVETLLRDVAHWHGELASHANCPDLQWAKSPFADFEFTEGSDEQRRIWRIRELLSTGELVAEGQRMQHCVASYAQSCASGKCSIWSVECEQMGTAQAQLTLELGFPENKIRQARGLCNRLPTDEEQAILARWVGSL